MRGHLLASFLLVVACGSAEEERMEAALADEATAKEMELAAERERADKEVVLATWFAKSYPKVQRCLKVYEAGLEYAEDLNTEHKRIVDWYMPMMQDLGRRGDYEASKVILNRMNYEADELFAANQDQTNFHSDSEKRFCTKKLVKNLNEAYEAAEYLGVSEYIDSCKNIVTRFVSSQEDSSLHFNLLDESKLPISECRRMAPELARNIGLTMPDINVAAPSHEDVIESDQAVVSSEEGAEALFNSDVHDTVGAQDPASKQAIAEMEAGMAEMAAEIAEMAAEMAETESYMAETE